MTETETERAGYITGGYMESGMERESWGREQCRFDRDANEVSMQYM